MTSFAKETLPISLEEEMRRSYLDYAMSCLLYTSDAADERSSVDLGGRRIIKKKKRVKVGRRRSVVTELAKI